MTFTLALPLVVALGGIGVVLPQGNAGDCDGNGVADAIEISSTPHLDTNGNGQLDSCEGFSVDRDRISLSQGGSQELRIQLGPTMAGSVYWILGSISGTAPGMKIDFASLPLNWDGPSGYMATTVTSPNGAYLQGGLGVLGLNGEATATFSLPPGFDPAFAGTTVNHAYLILGPDYQTFVWASNSVSVTLEP
jgi:hypothetical protein